MQSGGTLMQHAIDSKPELLTIIAAIVIAVLTVPVILLLLFMTWVSLHYL